MDEAKLRTVAQLQEFLDATQEVTFTGAPGEATQGPTAAAIGNAVYNALGIRIKQLPITMERILATD